MTRTHRNGDDMKNADTNTHTLDTITEMVPVREFRTRSDSLLRIVNVDFHACVNHSELMCWADRARRVAFKLSRTGCARARREDWDWREKALDRSASFLLAVADGSVRRASVAPTLRVVS